MGHQRERHHSFTSASNSLMSRCLLRWPDERLSPPFKPCERYLTGFSSNPRFLTVLTSNCATMHKLPGAQNFSDVPGKPMGVVKVQVLRTDTPNRQPLAHQC